jgi:hypothetical protein
MKLTSIRQTGNNYSTPCAGREQESSLEDGENGEAFGILEYATGYNLAKRTVLMSWHCNDAESQSLHHQVRYYRHPRMT